MTQEGKYIPGQGRSRKHFSRDVMYDGRIKV